MAENALRERTAGSPAARLSRAEHGGGRPDGCYSHALGSEAGTLTLLEVCPGRGGYRGGTAAEAFGIGTLRLSDPVTGEPIAPSVPGAAATTETVVIDPRVLAERAAAALALPAPLIRMNPEDDQVVHVPSWLWIPAGQWRPRQVAASAGPVTSTVTATPAAVRWDMGNGDTVRCDGPGVPYAPQHADDPTATDCRYTYRHSSAGRPDASYTVTATIEWTLTWTASGAPGGGSLGTVAASSTRPVRVTEIQALIQ